jgi:hypothetical protein
MTDFDLWIIEMFIIRRTDEFKTHLGACVGMLSVSSFDSCALSASHIDPLIRLLSSKPMNFYVLFSWGVVFRHRDYRRRYYPPI